MGVTRLDLSNNPVWSNGFAFNIYPKMFQIDSNEQNVYKLFLCKNSLNIKFILILIYFTDSLLS